jgi:fructokinase
MMIREGGNMDLVCLGELLVDMFPAELGRRLGEVSAFHPKPGGAPANVAVAARRLGADSAFIGKVGDDAFGHHLVEVLHTEGVDVSAMCFDDEARTTMAFIAQPDEDTSEFVFYRHPGADMRLREEELDLDMLRGCKAFHFGSISLIAEPSRSATVAAVREARDGGALISFDVNYRPTLWDAPSTARARIAEALPLADVVKVNEVELALLTDISATEDATRIVCSGELGRRDSLLQRGSRSLLAQGPDLCVVTLGREGSFFQTRRGGTHVAGFGVQTVDATGCGDAFVAGLLWQLVGHGVRQEGLDTTLLRNALRYANAVGALTSLTRGVIPALPTAAEVEAFLASHC